MSTQLNEILGKAFQEFQSGNFSQAESHLKGAIHLAPNLFDAAHLLAVVLASQGKHQEAIEQYRRALLINPASDSALSNLSASLNALGFNLEAIEVLKKAIAINPTMHQALFNAGNILCDLGEFKEATQYYAKASEILPQYFEADYNHAKALTVLNLCQDSLHYYQKALAINPHYLPCLVDFGVSLKKLKRYEEAIHVYDQALSVNAQYLDAWLNKGNVLSDLRKYDEALSCFDKVIQLNPSYPSAWLNKGNVFFQKKNFQEALGCYQKALALDSRYVEALSNTGNVHHELKRHEEALTFYDRALEFNPRYAEAWLNKGAALHALKRYKEAIAHYDQALIINPEYIEAWASKAGALSLSKLHADAATSYFKAHELSTEENFFYGQAHHEMMLACNWSGYENFTQEIFSKISQGKKSAEPFGLQGIATSEDILKKCAETISHDKYPALENLSKKSKHTHQKIHIGYLCGEFRAHATSILMTRIWELHDHSQFEIYAFDSGWDDHSEYRQRINKAFFKVIDISKFSDREAATVILDHKIDILINLNGFFGLSRQGVFAHKPAPIQVNYLGFPGTIGAPYMDYLIADKVVIPEHSRAFYTEKIAYLPNCYQANDNQRKISEQKFTRSELGLPDKGFIFASFNNNYKITPPTFDLWMRILKNTEDSVLWLLADNPEAKKNLIKEATTRGISSERIIFAERFDLPEHLARHQLADLFLDTLPYNAHTTASDALWSQLPVLTQMGATFPGRVSASLLKALDLEELIAHSEEEYVAMAIDFVKNPLKLKKIKDRLVDNLQKTALFDSATFAKNIEGLYVKMYGRYLQDLPPDHIAD